VQRRCNVGTRWSAAQHGADDGEGAGKNFSCEKVHQGWGGNRSAYEKVCNISRPRLAQEWPARLGRGENPENLCMWLKTLIATALRVGVLRRALSAVDGTVERDFEGLPLPIRGRRCRKRADLSPAGHADQWLKPRGAACGAWVVCGKARSSGVE
jgi:hypothetical protein